ncbi:GNAT family N-acetyltransferase [Agarivorans sp.]|uniref:GNAT family N-acetyltransferase n=1 Tax=Agarivorans sp. TaxID=1872412 RepID=UPI003CFF5719
MPIQKIVDVNWPQIVELQGQVYLSIEPETLQVLKSKWLNSPDSCFIYQEQGEVIGYLLAHAWHGQTPPKLFKPLTTNSQASVLFLHDLAVAKAAAGRGIGKSLFTHLLKTALAKGYQQIMLVAVQDSFPFWQKQGFKTVNQPVDPSYGEAAQLMIKTLVV